MLSDNIKRLMIINTISAKKLAEMVRVSPTHISYILNNKREPSIELLNKIAAALGVSIDEIFQDKSSNESSSSLKSILDEEKQKQIGTVAAHLEEKKLTPRKIKLLNEYIDILFNDEF
ncbi:helix-turn-helix domain-containing protein [Clostridium sp.]|uniref:helix-turn-helix domain-containing protein n=1 Tax=Clostridium sp. TaxID=1506 RepID=UPI0026389949|nr:helix-turn-helix transcriptional regulator [Clostridium sp.]